MRFFDQKNNRLVYVGSRSDSAYWDEHWDNDNFVTQLKSAKNNFIVNITKKYLPKGSLILEGGCGRGQNVYMLENVGYKCVGVDYAEQTVNKTNVLVPEIDVQLGDVRKLYFESDSFDGYWSLGVIEHFFHGYDDIVHEMYRVLKPGGVLFLTVPTMSRIRQFKAKIGQYPLWKDDQKHVRLFYQFALDPEIVLRDFEANGFEIIQSTPYDGFKGLKDEVGFIKPVMQIVYDSDNIILKILKRMLDVSVKSFTSHMTLFVFRKL